MIKVVYSSSLTSSALSSPTPSSCVIVIKDRGPALQSSRKELSKATEGGCGLKRQKLEKRLRLLSSHGEKKNEDELGEDLQVAN